MKKSKGVVLGAAALCVGMLGVAGCNNQVMGQRDYVSAEPGAPDGYQDERNPPMQQNPQEVPPQRSTPIRRPVPRQTAPIQYTPMEKLTSSPVTDVPKQGKGGADAPATKGETAHVIKAGDTIGHLAVRYGVSVSAIMQANNLDEAKARRLRIGQKLVIPGSSGAAKNADRNKDKGALPAGGAKISLNADGTYTVQPGDFPGKIARKLGVKESELMAVNNLNQDSAKRLQVGQKLAVPGKGKAISAVPKPATPETSAPAPQQPAPKDDQMNELNETLTGTDVPANGTQPAPTTEAPAASDPGSSATVPPPADNPDNADAGKSPEVVFEESVPMDVTEETTLEEFAAKYNTTAEKLKAMNPEIAPVDGKLKPGQVLFVPVQK